MELIDFDLVGLRDLVARGEVSPEEIARAYIDRIEQVEPTINGFAQFKPDRALDQAKSASNDATAGALAGLPYAVKDCLEVEGWITTFGTQGYSDHVSTYSATVAKRLEEAGGILLGITNAPELGASIETDNLLYGRTNNPIDLSRTPGGSTGGGAALVKAKALPFVVGSDFGGGSRNTAHCCGLFAHRPSLGLVSTAGYLFGCVGMKGQMCRLAPLARSVRDLELVFSVIGGSDPDDPKTDGVVARTPTDERDRLRIAVVANTEVAPCEFEIEAAITAFGNALSAGHEVETPDLGKVIAVGSELAHSLFVADAGRLMREALETVAHTETLSPNLQFWLNSMTRLSEQRAGDFEVLMARWEGYRLAINRLFETYDFLIWPAGPTIAPKHGETLDEQFFWHSIAYTTPVSLTASPVLVVPIGIGRNDMPITVQIIARSWADEQLLAFGRSLQEGDGPVRNLIELALAVPVQV
ncbi:MAG: amidase [Pseudomonadota bacterium]